MKIFIGVKNNMDKVTLKNILVIIGFLLLFGYFNYVDIADEVSYSMSDIPDYNGEDVIIINNNEPDFDDLAHTSESFEVYGELDSLGRCTAAYANIGKDLMPSKDREDISMIKPSGWKIIRYDFIEGEYLYNRCHLIGYQLTAENANEKNLITCTRYLNATTMLEYENIVSNYIRKTNNHVLYRVTPVYDGNNLLAKGVQMEALSVEDNGKGVKFNVFLYNIQPEVEIDYQTSESRLK